MSSLDELIKKAQVLLSEGHSPGQIADELSLSMETVTWLLTQQKGVAIPKDVHIDWTEVSGSASLLDQTAMLMLNHYYQSIERSAAREASATPGPEVVVGIAISGIPLATMIAVQEEAGLAIYHPKKQSTSQTPVGSISGNFSSVSGASCLIVDDVITSGNTMREVIEYLRRFGAQPLGILVIFDKRGFREIDGVPVCSLFKISRID